MRHYSVSTLWKFEKQPLAFGVGLATDHMAAIMEGMVATAAPMAAAAIADANGLSLAASKMPMRTGESVDQTPSST